MEQGKHTIRHSKPLKNYLEQRFHLPVNNKDQSFLILPGGTILHVRGCQELKDAESLYCFYHLYKNKLEFLLNNQNSFFAMVYDTPKTCIIIPTALLSSIFTDNLLTNISGKPLWYFYIRCIENKYFIDFRKKDVDRIEITSYLNNWEQVTELVNLDLIDPQNTNSLDLANDKLENGEVYSLQLNGFYNKKDIMQKFEVGAFGGIRVNSSKNQVVIFMDALPAKEITDYGRNIYYDKSDENSGLYYYTGQGQLGDQQLLRRGNKWLFDAISNPKIRVYLFRQYHPGGKHEYLGVVNVLRYTTEIQEDAKGNKRNVIIFVLKPISQLYHNEDDTFYREIESEMNYDEEISKNSLEERIRLISDTIAREGAKSGVKSIQRLETEYKRAKSIIKDLKLLHKKYCQVCHKEHFKKPKGVYSEVHHLIEWHISHDDTRENLVVICADCHRKFHHATKDQKQIMYDNLCNNSNIKYKNPL